MVLNLGERSNHQAHHIVNRLWPIIEQQAVHATKISVQLILEQNRFDFTENLARLKGLKQKKPNTVSRDSFQTKVERILEASGGICPYTGAAVSASSEIDIDHIVPRSGSYGLLNDEANLIASTVIGNRKVKGSRQLTLSELSPAYLEKQFGTMNVATIEKHICQTIQSDTGHDFKFGRYRQFIALTPEVQKAFRHALFLTTDHPLRRHVIDAISHRSKAKVNGTQRYMAQLIADILLQKAKIKGIAHKFSFDYFEVSSNGADEDSTVALRRYLQPLTENLEYDFAQFAKVDGQQQQEFSHVIDATMAFMLTLQKHQGEGAMRIYLDASESVWGNIDEDGVITPTVLETVIVKPAMLADSVQVKPQTVQQKAKILESQPSKKLHEVLNRTIFKQNAIGLEFYDLAQIEGKVFKGYVTEDEHVAALTFVKANSKPIDKNNDLFDSAVQLGFYRPSNAVQGGHLFKANKSALLPWLFDVLTQAKHGADSVSKTDSDLVKWIFGKNAGQLFYYSSKVSLEAAPSIVKKNEDSPYLVHWKRHYEAWNKKYPTTKVDQGRWIIAADQLQAWEEHCQKFLNRAKPEKRHSQVCEFTMRTSTSASGSPSLVKRMNGDGSVIYQLLMIDTNNFPKSQIAAIAKKSPRLALLNSDVLKHGYKVEIEEKTDLAGQAVEPSALFNIEGLSDHGIKPNQLQITVKSGTAVHVAGLPKEWVDGYLVKTGASEGRRWEKMKSLALATDSQQDDSIDRDRLNTLLTRSARSDKTVGVTLAGDLVTLTIPFKTTDFLVQGNELTEA
jgi:hypothetical protein